MSRPAVAFGVFAVALLALLTAVLTTSPALPATVASHFDADGSPIAFTTHTGYVRFVLLLGVGAPLALVGLLTAVVARVRRLKLPHHEYWLAPQRSAQTRLRLSAYGAWFGALLCAMVGCVHLLELAAHRTDPAQLPADLVLYVLFGFFLLSALWVMALSLAFRPPGLR
jgi:hypothetical protein